MKAKKLYTLYDKYYDTVVYEYRGRTYEVEYAKSCNVLVTPAYIQHKEAQLKIDEKLDNPKEVKTSEGFDLDEIWKMLEWE